MNLIREMLDQPLAHRLGWALVHSLWQGALAAGLFGLLRSVLRRHSANARYLAACLVLFLLALAPIDASISFCRSIRAPHHSASSFDASAGQFGAASRGISHCSQDLPSAALRRVRSGSSTSCLILRRQLEV